MRLLELLNQLDQAGTLSQLYQSGVLNLKAYNHRELALYYHALLATPTYAEQPSRAARATAEQCEVARSTVYLAIREMERSV